MNHQDLKDLKDRGQTARRAVFLDRDGTICEEVEYLDHIDQLKVFPGVPAAIRRLNEAGLKVIGITNQSGVARGFFSESFLAETHRKLAEILKWNGAGLDAVYYCPHHPEGSVPAYRRECDCRKPGIGLLERAAQEHNLDLASSFVVGDKYLDVETGFRAGARSILVLTGYGHEQYASQGPSWPRRPDYVATDLAQAVDWILEQIGCYQRQDYK